MLVFKKKYYPQNSAFLILRILELYFRKISEMFVLQTFRNNTICYKLAYFLRKIQTLRMNNSRIFAIKKCEIFRVLFLYNL